MDKTRAIQFQFQSLALAFKRQEGRVHNSAQLINTLPDEVLSENFLALRVTCGATLQDFNVRRVCRVWRNVVMSTLRVWSKFRVILSNTHRDSIAGRRVDEYLKLSGTVPLDIEVVQEGIMQFEDIAKPPSPTVTLILSTMPRCKKMNISGQWIVKPFLPFQQPLPLLEELTLPSSYHYDDDLTIAEHPMPQLRSFELTERMSKPGGLRLSLVQIAPLQITALRLTISLAANDIIDLIRTCLSLRTLALHCDGTLEPVPLTWVPQPVQLDLLEYLVVKSDVFRVLEFVTAPQVAYFEYAGVWGELPSSILGATSKFPQLRSITLHNNILDSAAEFRTLFANHPYLETLEISYRGTVSTSNSPKTLLLLAEDCQHEPRCTPASDLPVNSKICPLLGRRLCSLIIEVDNMTFNRGQICNVLRSLLKSQRLKREIGEGGFIVTVYGLALSGFWQFEQLAQHFPEFNYEVRFCCSLDSLFPIFIFNAQNERFSSTT